MFLAMSEEKRLPFAGYSFRRSDTRAQRSVGSELNCTAGKREGGSRERVPSPFSPLVCPRFFFLREFFSRAVLSERLEQATLSYNIRSKNNCLRTLTVFFFGGKRISRLSCLYARAYLKKCRRLKQNFGVFLNHGQNILFFFSKCSLRYPASSGFFLPDATGLEKPLLVG